MHLELLDIIIIVILGCGLVRGAMNGFLKQLAGLLGFVVGFILAKMLFQQLAMHLSPLFGGEHENLASIISFILIWLIVPLGFSLVASGLSKMMDSANLGFVNRAFGAVVGVAKWLLILTLLFNLYAWADPDDEIITKDTKESSFLYKPIINMGYQLLPYALRAVDKVKQEVHETKA